MDEQIIVPIELDVRKVRMLVSFINSTDSEDMEMFVEEILRKTNDISIKIKKQANEFLKENPFSSEYLGKIKIQSGV